MRNTLLVEWCPKQGLYISVPKEESFVVQEHKFRTSAHVYLKKRRFLRFLQIGTSPLPLGLAPCSQRGLRKAS